jgi:hypothetical protein
MKTGTKSMLLSVSLTIFSTCVLASDTNSHREAVEKLFDLTRMQHKIETSVDNVVAMQLNQDPAMRQHEALFRTQGAAYGHVHAGVHGTGTG